MNNHYKFLQKHLDEFRETLKNLQGNKWSLDYPVFLFNRDWFRLKKISLYVLAKELTPDNSQEAPEIIQYQQLLKEGHDHILAIQECWNEFGIEDFHRSLRNSSYWNSKGNNGWTFKKYVELLIGYRKNIEKNELSIPIIILGRNPKEDHELEWINEKFISGLTIQD